MLRISVGIGVALLVFGCAQLAPEPPATSSGHLDTQPIPGDQPPPLVQQAAPVLPEPAPAEEQERYTVVVNEVPVSELLFALARDAQVNVDIDPRVSGVVTLNAVEQTLPQLLERISRQVNLRYELDGDNLYISPDDPVFRTYRVDYVNMSRDTDSAITTATQIASTAGTGTEGGSGGGGGSNSTTDVSSVSVNYFWSSLVRNVQALIGEQVAGGEGAEIPISSNVIPHPETGMLTVRATSAQHKQIQYLLDSTQESAHRQVVIQATIVEVTLNDDYQAGIDWSFLDSSAGFDVVSSLTAGAFPLAGTVSSFVVDYVDLGLGSGDDRVRVTLRLLEEFGDIRVLSSPQLMVLNNQTAVLKVVDNVVYFTIEQESSQSQTSVVTTYETTIHTVPVGIVMNITPQISENDAIVLNVRPTISRVLRFVSDPNPALTTSPDGTPLQNPISNQIPEIAVREMESVLRMNNGQIGILGGLMQDDIRSTDRSVPGLSKLPIVGEAFTSRDRVYAKTELVIFLRPVVVRNPSLDGDLRQYRTYLERRP
jgi:general secretion pathway protein D